jgi:hypothetical protein
MRHTVTYAVGLLGREAQCWSLQCLRGTRRYAPLLATYETWSRLLERRALPQVAATFARATHESYCTFSL